jgi:hypothetical protein
MILDGLRSGFDQSKEIFVAVRRPVLFEKWFEFSPFPTA